MLKFIKNFFDDNEKIIGLCAFKKKGHQVSRAEDYFYKDFNKNKFVPTIDKNILLV